MHADGRDIMPQLVICNKCGAILYDNIELKPPDEIVQSYDGKCPNCGKKLSFIPKRVQVKPLDETNQPSPLETENKGPSRKKSWKKTKA
jgi:DNA-directed RNA polymerase subunit RPC12/RpoP